jgi:serine O-acetyltransferase
MTRHVRPQALKEAGIDCGEIVAALGALRRTSQRLRYSNGVVPQLPSREAVVGIVEGLVGVLYPRHFGPQDVSAASVDGYLVYRLDAALRSLQEQIRLELELFGEGGDSTPARRKEKAAEITAAFARALPRLRAVLDTDIRAAYDGDPAARSFDEVVFCYPGVAALIRHRLAHELYALGVGMLARIISETAHSETGIDIHPGAEIGESFFIDHGTGVVIGETARIGKRVRLYQAVTLGAKRFEQDEFGALVKGKPRHPIVEDDVVIYAGATVLGRITIGKGSAIGGNVWLTHSVPPGSNITQAKACVESFDNGAGI